MKNLIRFIFALLLPVAAYAQSGELYGNRSVQIWAQNGPVSISTRTADRIDILLNTTLGAKGWYLDASTGDFTSVGGAGFSGPLGALTTFTVLNGSGATPEIQGGSTSLLFKNNAANATNVTIADAGLVTVERGDLAVSTATTKALIAGAAAVPAAILTAQGTSPALYLERTTTDHAGFGQFGVNAGGVTFRSFKTRAATQVPTTIVNNADELFRWNFHGADGTNYDSAAAIVVTVDGAPSSGTDMPGAIDFLLSPDGSATPASALKLSNTKRATFGGDLAFTAGTTSIIPGATSVVITNAANSLSNFTFTDAGRLTALGSFISTTLALDSDVTNAFGSVPRLFIGGGQASADHVVVISASNDATGANIYGGKTRSTSLDANVVVNSGDNLVSFGGWGADGVVYRLSGVASFQADAAWGSGDAPTAFIIALAADGGTSRTERFRISNAGLVTLAGGLNITTPGATLAIQEATAGAACMGTTTANGTTAVTVATTCALTASRIFVSRTSAVAAGVTEPGCWATNIVNATSFDFDCNDAAENSTFNWVIFQEAA